MPDIRLGTTPYKFIHAWMNQNYPRVGRCEWCATTKRQTVYATAYPGQYTHNRADWLELCQRCHHFFDGVHNTRGMPGEINGRAKLTETDVREIRKLRAEGRTIVSLGEQFDVSHVLISRIARRRAWRHVA